MCYPKPGPRCTPHALKAYEKSKAAFAADKTDANYSAMMGALEGYEMTPGGIRGLKERVANNPTPDLHQRLEKAVIGRKLALEEAKANAAVKNKRSQSNHGSKKEEKTTVAAKPKVPTAKKSGSTAQSQENQIVELFDSGAEFTYNGEELVSIHSAKPKVSAGRGEPKADVYILAKSKETGDLREIKVSYKQPNAHFLENKMNAERFHSIVGEDKESVENIKSQANEVFSTRVFTGQTAQIRGEKETVYTLGYRADILQVDGGGYVEWEPSKEQLVDIYAGTSLGEEKRNAIVPGNNDGKPVENAGVASHMLVGKDFQSVQEAADRLVPIEDHVEANPKVYFAFKAVNYRQSKDKWDTNRPLMFAVDWEKDSHGDPVGKLRFDSLFATTANPVGEHVRSLLK